MAKRSVLKILGIVFAVWFALVVLAGVIGWLVIRRGPAVPDHATVVLRIGAAVPGDCA